MASFFHSPRLAEPVEENILEATFRRAIQLAESDVPQKYIIERHESRHTSAFGTQSSTTTFSIRPSSNSPQSNMSPLWAKRHIMAKAAYYVISASADDLDAPKDKRSPYFLGKLKSIHGTRVYTGFSYMQDSFKTELVTVVYDHERAPGDRKMETAIALPPTPLPGLTEQFMRIRHEGMQNHATCANVLVFNQLDDTERMQCTESLNDFGGDARMVSTKNFQLVKSVPFRQHHLPAICEEKSMEEVAVPLVLMDNGDSEVASVATGPAVGSDTAPPVQQITPTTASSRSSFSDPDIDGSVHDAKVVYVQLGKLENDLFSCSFRSPFTLLQAFMVCLSRFDTNQKY